MQRVRLEKIVGVNKQNYFECIEFSWEDHNRDSGLSYSNEN